MRKLSAIAGSLGIVVAAATTASAATLGLVPDNGCIYYATVKICDADIQPTGTGIFDPFLRTNPGGNQSPSSGWNTDANINSAVNDADDAWTSALAKSGLTTTTDGYVVFTVDINQQGTPNDNDSLLSLAHFQLFSCTTATYTGLTAADGCISFFNLFGGSLTDTATERPVITTTQWVDFDYRFHTGSGSGDISIFIPVGMFAGATNPYIALLDGWGQPGAYADNDGFQEWRALSGLRECPVGENCDVITAEPAAILLFGLAAFGSAYRMRRRQMTS